MNERSGSFLFSAVVAATMAVIGCSKAPEPVGLVTPAPATVATVTDIDVTERVKSALQKNESLKGFDINVVTVKGDVRLIGMLDNQAQIDVAVKIARASDGTQSIRDELTIKK